ncbi:MAG: helix-turn-helix domain-containing protein [Candidatus Hydrogenedentota bacterium]|nr:MAG: helix-turn-helix domain-containing protein [Candidatus Hydrogenedentota bacterium]
MQKQRLSVAQKIKQKLKGVNDEEVRKKAYVLLLVLESKRNIKQACAHYGLPRRNFYRWIKLLQEGNFDLSVLKAKSRRPHRSPVFAKEFTS